MTTIIRTEAERRAWLAANPPGLTEREALTIKPKLDHTTFVVSYADATGAYDALAIERSNDPYYCHAWRRSAAGRTTGTWRYFGRIPGHRAATYGFPYVDTSG